MQIIGFQSTLPAWGATHLAEQQPKQGRFQSTLPAWGATTGLRPGELIGLISIHAPRMGSDPGYPGPAGFLPDFNPRSPYGERQQRCIKYISNTPKSYHKYSKITICPQPYFLSLLFRRRALGTDFSVNFSANLCVLVLRTVRLSRSMGLEPVLPAVPRGRPRRHLPDRVPFYQSVL